MSPEDREWIKAVAAQANANAEGLKAVLKFAQTAAETQKRLIAQNAVLMMACGALYAELAQATGGESQLTEMLARLVGTIQGGRQLSDDAGSNAMLEISDSIQEAAESLMMDLRRSA